VERDICLIATAQRPNGSYNKGYIAYFLLRMRETAIFPLPIWGRFQLIFSIGKQKVRYISTSGLFGLLTWKVCHVLGHPRWSFPPSLKLIRLSIAELQRCWCGYVTWPFDLGQWSNMAGHVVNPSTKFEDPTPIRSW